MDGLVGSPCNLMDSQESSPTPQSKSINSLALSFLYSPTLTSLHDYWKNHSLDCCCCCQVTSVVSDSVRPHRRQLTRLPHPWDSLGKNTGVGCHFLLQCMKAKSEREVTQLCLTLSDPTDCSLPGSSVHGIFQARVLEWGASAFSENSCYFKAKDHRSQYPNAGET